MGDHVGAPAVRAGLDPAALARALGVLERGEALEPEDGYYPLWRAGLLVAASAETYDDEARGFEAPTSDGRSCGVRALAVTVYDPVRFAQALETFRIGAAKSAYAGHPRDRAEVRLALASKFHGPGITAGVNGFDDLSDAALLRGLCRAAVAHAASTTDPGQAETRSELLRRVDTLAAGLGGRAEQAEELALAIELRRLALGHAQVLRTAVGDVLGAAAAHRRMIEEDALLRDALAGGPLVTPFSVAERALRRFALRLPWSGPGPGSAPLAPPPSVMPLPDGRVAERDDLRRLRDHFANASAAL